MLSGICIGTNDLAAAGKFYDEVLAIIGMSCVFAELHERGYAGEVGRIAVFRCPHWDPRGHRSGMLWRSIRWK